MSRVAGFLLLALFALPLARADEVAWTAADQAQLTSLAKKAKKNGEMFTVTGDVFEARLPTREAAAEFCLYFERLAERIRPVWGTRENTTKVVAIALHPKDKAWPADASGQKIAFESVPTKQQPDVPMQVASIHLWVHPDLAADALAVAAIPRTDLNRVGLNALLTRLAGRNPRPAWFDDGLHGAFANWSPVMPEGDAGRLDAATREPSVVAAMKEACAAKDPLDTLLPYFVETKKRATPTAVDAQIFASFFVFLLEHKKGQPLIVDTATSLSRGKPPEVEKKQITKLVPLWREWAGLGAAVSKS